MSSGEPENIIFGPDGAVWFTMAPTWVGSGLNTAFVPGGIGRMTTSGSMSIFGAGSLDVWSPVAGPDGAVWFIDAGYFAGTSPNFTHVAGGIVRITSSGVTAMYQSGDGVAGSTLISGPDDSLWYPQVASNGATWSIKQLSTTGQVLDTFTSAGLLQPMALATDPDGALWFANYSTDTIGRLAVP